MIDCRDLQRRAARRAICVSGVDHGHERRAGLYAQSTSEAKPAFLTDIWRGRNRAAKARAEVKLTSALSAEYSRGLNGTTERRPFAHLSLRGRRGERDLLAARSRESGEVREERRDLERHVFPGGGQGHRLGFRQFHLIGPGIELDASAERKRGNLIGALADPVAVRKPAAPTCGCSCPRRSCCPDAGESGWADREHVPARPSEIVRQLPSLSL